MIDGNREQPPSERELRLERELRDARTARQTLLSELQNRSRNTLSLIRSLLRRTATGSHSVEEFAHHLEGRLGAYGRAQAAVIRDPTKGVDFASLLSDELLAHAVHEGANVTVTGPEVRLQPRAAELFALLFNELTLNAVKFGALQRNVGRVDVSWVLSGDDGESRLTFRWQETNDTPGQGPVGAAGFGTEFVEKTLLYELGATGLLTHDSTGTACSIQAATDAILVRGYQSGGGDSNGASASPR